jgi:hypothetical protein
MLRAQLERRSDRLDRIENAATFGMPDVNGCLSGVEFWMELKAPKTPKRDSTPLFGSNHNLSVNQRNWFLRQTRAGGIAFVYIDATRHRILVDGSQADIINTATLSELLTLAAWWAPKPTPKESWAELRKTIIARKGNGRR